eukprot:scaffold27464_cov107-Isochrysis_galbana.AAC.5
METPDEPDMRVFPEPRECCRRVAAYYVLVERQLCSGIRSEAALSRDAELGVEDGFDVPDRLDVRHCQEQPGGPHKVVLSCSRPLVLSLSFFPR